jgi:hypothetical protein
MTPSANGVLNQPTPAAGKKVQDFIFQIRQRIAKILQSAKSLEREVMFVDSVDDWSMFDFTCSSEIEEIEAAATQMLRWVERLERKAQAAEAAAARAERFIPKRRNKDRDAKIVRMHDEERQSFGQIALALGGIGSDGVRKAYHRHKADKSSCPGKT